jgi:hypothetical protein
MMQPFPTGVGKTKGLFYKMPVPLFHSESKYGVPALGVHHYIYASNACISRRRNWSDEDSY